MSKLPRTVCLQEKYGPAMAITTQTEADAYFEMCVEHSLEHSTKTRDEIEDIERSNLAYYAGYYDYETRERVERLFKCEHPVLGAASKTGKLTPEQLFEIGFRLGQDLRRKE